MAEEGRIERRRPRWPWAVLVILALVLFMWGRGTSNEDAERAMIERGPQGQAPAGMPDTARATPEDSSAPAEVSGFLRFAAERRLKAVGTAHDYTADGVRQLAAALDAVARTQAGLPAADARRHIAAMRRLADELQRDAQALEHANRARAAFVAAAQAMEVLQPEDRASDAAVQAVRNSAEGVDTDRPMLDQAAQIEDFFYRCAQALRTLAQSSA